MVRLRYSSYILHTKSTKVHVAESSINKPVFNVQRSMLNVGSWANYSELCIYILVYCTATQSFLCLLLENFSDVSLWVRESTSQQNTLGHTPVIYLWCSTSGFAMVVRASSTTGDQLERSDRLRCWQDGGRWLPGPRPLPNHPLILSLTWSRWWWLTSLSHDCVNAVWRLCLLKDQLKDFPR